MSSHDSATQDSCSRSHHHPPYNQESLPQITIEDLQKALKAQVLHSLRFLRRIAEDYPSFNLELEIIDSWVADIEGVNATTIPIPSSMAVEAFAFFGRLTSILTEYITTSGPMRSSTIRDQALELLTFILGRAEEYCLVQSPHVYLDIGRFTERLTQTNMGSEISFSRGLE